MSEGQKEERNAADEICLAWLCGIPGLYLAQQNEILEWFKSPANVFDAPDGEFDELEKRGCLWAKKVKQYKRRMSPEKFGGILGKRNIRFIGRQNPCFPGRLLGIPHPPNGLFYKGELPDEDARSVAVVGARMCTRYGRETAEQIARMVARCGGQLVSGAALGIDGIAQMEALRSGGKSFGVLGCGVGRIYPQSNAPLFAQLEQQGGIISEFPPDAQPLSFHFPVRNRLISGLADVVVVVEAKKKSGSLITADYAAEQGREVYAVPGRAGDELSEGCNELIFHGAGIFLSVGQLKESIFGGFWEEKAENSICQALAPSEKLVYSNLNLHSRSLHELQMCTELSPSELGEALIKLELDGLIRETEKNYYAKAR